mmetsp:Transcript_9300/g.31090  ORF Transcript_9300/g.31090 Transcript_9300/m.31090 type:complete len:132 (-) Transcript_9300:1143-1538(-)
MALHHHEVEWSDTMLGLPSQSVPPPFLFLTHLPISDVLLFYELDSPYRSHASPPNVTFFPLHFLVPGPPSLVLLPSPILPCLLPSFLHHLCVRVRSSVEQEMRYPLVPVLARDVQRSDTLVSLDVDIRARL